MKERYEVVQDSNGKFYFHLRAADGAVLLSSLACDSKITAKNELLHLRNSLREADRVIEHEAGDHTRFVVVKDHDGTVLARSPHVDPATSFPVLLATIREAAGAPMLDLSKRRHATAT